MAITTFKRYEKKYLLDKEKYELLTERLLEYMNYDEHCLNGKDYTIYNIYYDTKDNKIIEHSLSKPYYKEKLRLRSYKPIKSKDDKVFLEIKKKINGIVSKRRVVLTLEQVNKLLEFGERPKLDDYMSNQVLDEIEYFLSRNKINPAVAIHYKRTAFFGKEDKDFRVTFDNHIMTRRYNLNLTAEDYGYDLLKEGERLMEVKILGAMPMWLSEILSDLSIFPIGFSKYGNEYRKYYVTEGRGAVC